MRIIEHPRRLVAVVALAFAAAGAAVGVSYWSERAWLRAEAGRVWYHAAPSGPQWAHIALNGVNRPPVLEADQADLGADEEVLGVEVGGKARAYRLDALRDKTRHVVNDLVGGVPVSVSYCDIFDCARAYTEPHGSSPLGISVAGLLKDSMVIKIGETYYSHKTGQILDEALLKQGLQPAEVRASRTPFPYAPAPLSRTTWKRWREQHPQSEVYTGKEPRRPEG